MPEIRVLPEDVASQIAAGEVVERPASVVKELLENSLDAGATRISVEFRHGGRALIVVEDNGCGMTADQAVMSLEMHATSKVRAASDLEAIRTFGFRGEAVPSIASVSRFTLRTRPAQALMGTELVVNAGRLLQQKETGMAPGTRIEVANLFHPVPARLKFMKTENTEAAHITRLVRLYAVAQPQVGFLLMENGQEIFRSPASDNLSDRVREIWGKQLAADLLPLAPVDGVGMRLHGLLGKAGVGRSTRQEMVTIVNGRPVDSRVLAYSLVESYHTLLPKGRFPLAFLFFEIDPYWVDVNVHPAKREVRFRDEARVRHFVISAVLRHLEETNAIPPIFAPAPTVVPGGIAVLDARSRPEETAAAEESARVVDVPLVCAPADGASRDNSLVVVPRFSHQDEAPARVVSPVVAPPVSPPTNARIGWRLAGQLPDEILLFETPSGLLVFNLKAARARIWYERILQRFERNDLVSQQLLLPIPLELEPLAANILRERQAFLREAGFDLAEFGRNFFRIQAVPDWLPEEDVERSVRDILAVIGRSPGETQRKRIACELLAGTVAEWAMRGSGGALSGGTVDEVLRELFLCRQPTVCPRGRPIFFEMTRAELSRRFGNE
ncbi:MAG: DNA mismatch repair endonuclease MutL [Puniceicoccales bacterium]|jgi:DNA mismatch repair protein MutL|nr:DNA mismatch repair endonuclease MutL [Puniceicoccales bacterium]